MEKGRNAGCKEHLEAGHSCGAVARCKSNLLTHQEKSDHGCSVKSCAGPGNRRDVIDGEWHGNPLVDQQVEKHACLQHKDRPGACEILSELFNYGN
eukprot:1140115-Pelagomonas_calceolata.AAC.11